MNVMKLVFGVLFWIGITIGLLLVILSYNGLVKWGKTGYVCQLGAHFYAAGDKIPLATVGRLQVLQQPYAWGCPEIERMDPAVWQLENGIATPRHQ